MRMICSNVCWGLVGRVPPTPASVSLDLVTWTVGLLGGKKWPSVVAICLLASFLGASGWSGSAFEVSG